MNCVKKNLNLCKNTLIFYAEFTKKLILFPIFTPRFLIQKFKNVVKPFLKGGNVLFECPHYIFQLIKQ